MSINNKVYLDHLIPRENLRYRRSSELIDRSKFQVQTPSLQLMSLLRASGPAVSLLRKPDFQRATWAWTSEECCSLLDSLTNNQVIPSVIMWSSPENDLNYILDGSHRISVVLAWLNDDWGDKLPSEKYGDPVLEREVKTTANQVRTLVAGSIGQFEQYKRASEEYIQINDRGGAAKQEMSTKEYERATFYNRLMFGNVDISLQWVQGNYETAERSFLKINGSGQHLSEWEQDLVENRNSSFARAVMSISFTATAKHYWPGEAPDDVSDKQELESKIGEILNGIEQIHSDLFKPLTSTPVKTMVQPLLVADTYQKPYYLAEFLTVVEHGRGSGAETKRLMIRDRNATPEHIIRSGSELITSARNTIAHLKGPSPKSLALIPTLYFYTSSGRYVRSLLYGFVYWLCSGTADEILKRKRLFSAHRSAFEDVLLQGSDTVVSALSRRSGSGPEVTPNTAVYFHEILSLLIQHSDAIDSLAFKDGYSELTRRILGTKLLLTSREVTSSSTRLFSASQKTAAVLTILHDSAPRCEICGGRYDPHGDTQHDHRIPYAQGGTTSSDNQRLVHPFCNNPANRAVIEGLRGGTDHLDLPAVADLVDSEGARQLSFYEDPLFSGNGIEDGSDDVGMLTVSD